MAFQTRCKVTYEKPTAVWGRLNINCKLDAYSKLREELERKTAANHQIYIYIYILYMYVYIVLEKI